MDSAAATSLTHSLFGMIPQPVPPSLPAATDSEPAPAVPLDVTKVDHFMDKRTMRWEYQASGVDVVPEHRSAPTGQNDPWKRSCFVVVREFPADEKHQPYFRIIVKSKFLLKACKETVGEIPGISWNTIPMELDPHILLARLPEFKAYKDGLETKENPSEEDNNVLSTVDVLINYFETDYRETIASIKNFKMHGEISFPLLWAVFLPREVIVRKNLLTSALEALRIISAVEQNCLYMLTVEGVDVGNGDDMTEVAPYLRTETVIAIPSFQGVQKVTSLVAYPLSYHPECNELEKRLIERGQRWARIAGGLHHMEYRGTGGIRQRQGLPLVKYTVNSRVMIDRLNFGKLNPNYPYPVQKKEIVPQTYTRDISPQAAQQVTYSRSQRNVTQGELGSDSESEVLCFGTFSRGFSTASVPGVPVPTLELTDEDLLIASSLVYGFSLADKIWLEFDIDKLSEIEWETEAFSNLIIPEDRKTLLRSLIEAHNAGSVFDDFIKGKGRGLVINLFGPPGVGKTLTAEATSELVKKPLYVVGSGDLGTNSKLLDHHLKNVFQLATAWKAIVLIDEADVFLEQRSMHDLERNAMVAIFLRHLEYYPAILFLTTNRVKAFDHAFLSRIHIALHFRNLSRATLKSIWTAFLKKAGVIIGSADGISDAQLDELANKNLNGRQVKNAVKTSISLAMSRNESLSYNHLLQVLEVMEMFTVEFNSINDDAEN